MGAENRELSCIGFDSREPFANSPWQKNRHRGDTVETGLNFRIASE